MTDPYGESVVDEIVVTGQRRRPGGVFPAQPGGTGGAGGPGGVEQVELDPDWQPPPDPPHPCGDPETAFDWNNDAAAAEALRRMNAARENNNEPDFALREYGTAIYRFPDGSFRIGTIRWGTSQAGTVFIDYDEMPEAYLISVIHSHPSGGGTSSDTPVLTHIRERSMYGAQTRLYTLTPTYTPGNPAPVYRLMYYDQRNIQGVGVEVNPEGQPCPGASVL